MSGAAIERKIVSISQKRQITIPQKFYSKLGFDKEAECVVRGNELVLRPARESGGGEFSEQILEDLINQGLSGRELLDAFKEKQAKVRPAVGAMLMEAKIAASGKGEFKTVSDVFGED